ncbi:hypothetical protein DSL64_24055 [Dyadobacter luteus]|uniref:Uncharacterized protein n=1 Tax=Dyadobacter luteus TaxID=2259619 RepID=A0A3D8Y4Z6_9BACT|nr:DUF4105 domain-containing protein [Dyadobacter luteus]REA57430.1 hypothetical protein DSL64_24055 [Dyadobacter luteus]
MITISLKKIKECKTFRIEQTFLYVLLLGLSLTFHPSFGTKLSPSAKVSLITYGPGDDDISSAFGHTEIRFVDTELGIDRNYSYGGFNHHAKGFILKFLQGTLPYYLAVHSLADALPYYQQSNRSITEQILNLSHAQSQQLFDALEKNYLLQNRYYQYKFYYDNCATRPRDMIAAVCGDSLEIPTKSEMTGKSYRDWMNEYLEDKPWYQLGMNMAIGHPSDQQLNGWNAMYLPDQLSAQLENATVTQSNGRKIPFVKSKQALFSSVKANTEYRSWISAPDGVFTILAILLIVFSIARYVYNKKADRWLDLTLFGVSGLAGWLLLFPWVIRDDDVTSWNPVLLYLMPFHIPFIFVISMNSASPTLRRLYFAVTAGLILGGMIFSKIPGVFDFIFPAVLLSRCLLNWLHTHKN